MARLISRDEDGEAWFDNPSLVLANPRRRRRSYRRNYAPAGEFSARISAAESRRTGPAFYEGGSSSGNYDPFSGTFATKKKRKAKRKRGKRMAGHRPRNSRGRFVKSKRATHKRKTTKRRASRSRAAFAVRVRGRKRVYRGRARGRVVRIRVNPRRRRRHSFLGNPGAAVGQEMRLPFGLSLPALDSILWAGSGVIVAPMISRQIMSFLPPSVSQTTYGPWIADIASVLIPGMLLRKFVSPRAGNLFMIGASVNLTVKAIKQFAPSLAPTLGLTGQPLLGSYFKQGNGRGFPSNRSIQSLPAVMNGAPERLDPSGRF